MKPDASESEFRALLRNRGLSEHRLTGANALAAMGGFYRDRRPEDCNVTADGDMLLCQWGVYGFGRPHTFQFDITRQFIIGIGEDDEIFQLRFTLHYPVSDEIRTIKVGNRWCGSPQETAAWEDFVRSSAAFHYSSSRLSEEVEIRYGCAG